MQDQLAIELSPSLGFHTGVDSCKGQIRYKICGCNRRSAFKGWPRVQPTRDRHLLLSPRRCRSSQQEWSMVEAKGFYESLRHTMRALLPNRGTLPAQRHLKKKHQMLLDELDNSEVTSVATSDSSFEPPPGYMNLVTPMNIDRFRHHLLYWIVKRQLPFTTVDDEDFKAMLLAISPSTERYLIGKSTVC
jgi:hypothetical protein